MATKKVEKSAKKSVVKKETTKKRDKQAVSNKNLPGITPEEDKIALKRQKFTEARKNDSTLVVRISQAILEHLSELGWSRGGGAATIAREVLESWYAKEVERANAKVDSKKSARA